MVRVKKGKVLIGEDIFVAYVPPSEVDDGIRTFNYFDDLITNLNFWRVVVTEMEGFSPEEEQQLNLIGR